MWSDGYVASEPERQLQMFVEATIFRGLIISKALKRCSNDEWLSHVQHLVQQTLNRLTVPEGFDLDLSKFNHVAMVVVLKLRKKFGDLVKYHLLMQDPDVEETIVQCFHAHIKKEIVRQKRFFDTKELIFTFIFHNLRSSISAISAALLTVGSTMISAWLITVKY